MKQIMHFLYHFSIVLACAAPFAVQAAQATNEAKPLRILILGGTGFLGPATIDAALARGHMVTMFNRGKTRPDLYPTVEKLHGDRDPKKGEGLKALETGEWDVVIDNSAYYPRMVTASASLLAPRCKQYILISSVSAYKDPVPVHGDENASLATMPDPTQENMGKSYEYYGALKALCERAAEKAMPGRVTVVRPGFIVGPDDSSGRFTYWPVRFSRGGEVAVPGKPTDPIQIIDVRDLGEWLVKLAENGTTGTFNACGPAQKLSWGTVIEACQKVSPANTKTIWLPAEFVAHQDGLDFPIWVPPTGETAGFHTWSNERAVKAGLRFRPVEATVKDTLEWYKSQEKAEKGRDKLAGPSAESEAKALAAWKAEKTNKK
jgi:2'-hydroxyisoflavone reductase